MCSENHLLLNKACKTGLFSKQWIEISFTTFQFIWSLEFAKSEMHIVCAVLVQTFTHFHQYMVRILTL